MGMELPGVGPALTLCRSRSLGRLADCAGIVDRRSRGCEEKEFGHQGLDFGRCPGLDHRSNRAL